MEDKFFKNLNNESKKLVKAITSNKELIYQSKYWGNHVFVNCLAVIKKLIAEIKSNYPKNLKNKVSITITKFDINKCGNVPCIYKLFLENKKIVRNILIERNDNLLLSEFDKMVKNINLNKFQNFINKIRDLQLLTNITNSISSNDKDWFLDLFIPSEIQHEMEQYSNLWLIEGVYKDVKVKIISSKKNNNELILQIIGRIITLKNMMNWTSNISVVLLDSKQKRLYSERNVGRREVNGGYTWRGSGKIHIFRKEECKKVLLHELIHTFDVDYKHEHDMCESHAELYGLIMNIMFSILEAKLKLNINLVKLLLSIEYVFSKIQEKKIYNLLVKNKISTLAKGYYIYKSLILENLDKYFEVIRVGDPIFSFPIENNEKFKVLIKNFTRYYENNFEIPSKLKNTLRMTCIEI